MGTRYFDDAEGVRHAVDVDDGRPHDRPPLGELDAAWAEVEAALPEGWSISSLTRSWEFGPFVPHQRSAGIWLDDWEVYAKGRPQDGEDGLEYGSGPTPAAALLALAAALRG